MFIILTGAFALSILDDSRKAKHFRIQKDDEGKYFIQKSRPFAHIPELVEHYMSKRTVVPFVFKTIIDNGTVIYPIKDTAWFRMLSVW